jgi:hypothetical protein
MPGLSRIAAEAASRSEQPHLLAQRIARRWRRHRGRQRDLPRGSLLEIKRLDLPSSATKDQVYHWLRLTNSAVSSL